MKSNQTSVGLLICTSERPEMLKTCLRSVAELDIPETIRLEVCVIENDTQPKSKHVVEEFDQNSGIEHHYYMEPERGIPQVRNRSLQAALDHDFEWIGSIDDDETVAPDWLVEHLASLQAFDAQASYGKVIQEFEEPYPDWWPHITTAVDKPAGTRLTWAATGNCMFSRKLIAEDGLALTYRTELKGGFEDLDFFERANKAGIKIIWTPAAKIFEFVPKERVEKDRLLTRMLSSSRAQAQVAVLNKGWIGALKFTRRGFKRIVSGGFQMAFGVFADLIKQDDVYTRYNKGLLTYTKGIGNLLGVMRGTGNFYNKIDGF